MSGKEGSQITQKEKDELAAPVKWSPNFTGQITRSALQPGLSQAAKSNKLVHHFDFVSGKDSWRTAGDANVSSKWYDRLREIIKVGVP